MCSVAARVGWINHAIGREVYSSRGRGATPKCCVLGEGEGKFLSRGRKCINEYWWILPGDLSSKLATAQGLLIFFSIWVRNMKGHFYLISTSRKILLFFFFLSVVHFLFVFSRDSQLARCLKINILAWIPNGHPYLAGCNTVEKYKCNRRSSSIACFSKGKPGFLLGILDVYK